MKHAGLGFDTLLRRSARRLFPGESCDVSVRPGIRVYLTPDPLIQTVLQLPPRSSICPSGPIILLHTNLRLLRHPAQQNSGLLILAHIQSLAQLRRQRENRLSNRGENQAPRILFYNGRRSRMGRPLQQREFLRGNPSLATPFGVNGPPPPLLHHELSSSSGWHH